MRLFFWPKLPVGAHTQKSGGRLLKTEQPEAAGLAEEAAALGQHRPRRAILAGEIRARQSRR